jgi:RHS repeat-associated protein
LLAVLRCDLILELNSSEGAAAVKSRHFLVCVLTMLAAVPLRGATSSSGTRLITVVTGELPGTMYRTTVELRSTGSAPAECRFEFRSAKRPTTPLVSVVPVAAGRPTVLDEFLRELPVATTVRVNCTADVEVYSRLHASTDRGATYDEGHLFRAIASAPVLPGAEKSVQAVADLIIAETSGQPAAVVVRLARQDGGVATKTYDLLPFGQRILDLTDALPIGGSVTAVIHNKGGGSVVILRETRDPKLADRARRMTDEQRRRFEAHVAAAEAPPAPAPSITQQLLLSPFKGAPFREPATGLVFMRDRVYDPSTGTFLTPDPEGYHDSSNPYAYCGGDPVNCSDPTGRMGDGGDLREHFRQKERAEQERRYRIWCAQNPVECQKAAVRGRGIVRMVGGVGQTAAGTGAVFSTGPLPEPVTKGFGGTAIVRGIDNTITGAVETWTGTPRSTVTGRAVYLALVRSGVDPRTASRITGWTEAGVDFVSGVGSGVVSGINASRALPAVRQVPGLTGLRFGSDDLVYGPSARGYLRALQQEAGGVLLDDLPKPPSLSWEQFTTRTLDAAASSGRRVRFDLTHVDDLQAVLRGQGEWANTVTAYELRYLQANWSRFQKVTHFYENGIEVAAPWVR